MDAVLQTDEEKNTKVGFMRLLNMNKKEWPYIITGMLSAAGQGTIMPLFAVILSSLIAALMPGVPSSRILRFSILFWCLGAAQFVLSSVQVCKRRPHPHANVWAPVVGSWQPCHWPCPVAIVVLYTRSRQILPCAIVPHLDLGP